MFIGDSIFQYSKIDSTRETEKRNLERMQILSEL